MSREKGSFYWVCFSGHLGTSAIASFVSTLPLVCGGVWPAIIVSGFVSLFFGTMSAFLLNDLHDIERDSVGKPYRPLVSGKLDPLLSWRIFKATHTTAILFAVILVVLTPWGLLLLAYLAFYRAYGWVNDHCILLKNLFISTAFVFPAIYSAGCLGAFWENGALYGAVYFFFVGRELLMDVNDMVGDFTAGYRTIPNRLGCNFAANLVGVLWCVAIALGVVQCLGHPTTPFWSYVQILGGIVLLLQYALWRLGGLDGPRLRILVLSTWFVICLSPVYLSY